MSETDKEFVDRMKNSGKWHPADRIRLLSLALRGAEIQKETEALKAALQKFLKHCDNHGWMHWPIAKEARAVLIALTQKETEHDA